MMRLEIRRVVDTDLDVFVNFVLKLSAFNRANHDEKCKYDDYEKVKDSIKESAKKTFLNRDSETLILLLESNGKPLGYGLARIFEVDDGVDNGTGRMGLLDEIYVEDSARGMGGGQKLIDETLKWMKENKIKRIKLHAYSWNEKAKKLYEQNGFTESSVTYQLFI